MDIDNHPLVIAAETLHIEKFLRIVFPLEWQSVASRIVETGAMFAPDICAWAPRWSMIPHTKKNGKDSLEAAVKSCLYKAHDCIHQLWGLPIPSYEYTEEEYYNFKRASMCGEVAVLTLIEFSLAKHFVETWPETKPYIVKRCALSMLEGPLRGKSILEIAMRLDDILHKQRRPKWVRDHEAASKFADYYIPMLEDDRDGITWNWNVMKENRWLPNGAPNSRYSNDLDGLELTIWMIEDFYHLSKTDSCVDYSLTLFNQDRRSKIILPSGWGQHKTVKL